MAKIQKITVYSSTTTSIPSILQTLKKKPTYNLTTNQQSPSTIPNPTCPFINPQNNAQKTAQVEFFSYSNPRPQPPPDSHFPSNTASPARAPPFSTANEPNSHKNTYWPWPTTPANSIRLHVTTRGAPAEGCQIWQRFPNLDLKGRYLTNGGSASTFQFGVEQWTWRCDRCLFLGRDM